MANARRDSKSRTDRDGVRITTTQRRSPLVPAVLVVALLAWLVGRTWTEEPPRSPAPAPTAGEAVRPANEAAQPATASPPGIVVAAKTAQSERARQRREERQATRRGELEPTFTVNAPGETAGIAAFPPPGTKPVKRGIVVPDDFELPPGYVRHYQATDDGRPLPPILMFHPDFAGVDANGNPIVVPEDRIVPPELAPPGLPIHTLDETTDVDQRVGRKDHTGEAKPTR